MSVKIYSHTPSTSRLQGVCTRPSYLKLAAVAALAVAAGACGDSGPKSETPAAPAGSTASPLPASAPSLELEKTDLKFGFIKLTDMAPLAVAYEKGFFEDEGLERERNLLGKGLACEDNDQLRLQHRQAVAALARVRLSRDGVLDLAQERDVEEEEFEGLFFKFFSNFSI